MAELGSLLPLRTHSKILPGASGHPQFTDMLCCTSEIVWGVPIRAVSSRCKVCTQKPFTQ